MNKKEINKDHIVSVEQKGFEKVDVKWESSALLGLIKEGYHYYNNILTTEEDFKNNNLVEFEPRGGLYKKPKLIINLTNGYEVKEFDSEANMISWRKKNFKGINLIKI